MTNIVKVVSGPSMMSKPRAETVFVRGSNHRQRLITQNGETLRKSRPLVTSSPSMQTLLVNIMPVFARNLLIAETCLQEVPRKQL